MRERWIDLIKSASRYVKWDDFVFACAAKVDVLTERLAKVAAPPDRNQEIVGQLMAPLRHVGGGYSGAIKII